MFKKEVRGLRYSEHVAGDGSRFRAQPASWASGAHLQAHRSTVCTGQPRHLGQAEVPQPRRIRGRRWTDPEGGRSHIGALLLGYYTGDANCIMPAVQTPA
jgi:bifunctional non-homologous end joining protein LigD